LQGAGQVSSIYDEKEEHHPGRSQYRRTIAFSKTFALKSLIRPRSPGRAFEIGSLHEKAQPARLGLGWIDETESNYGTTF
jgi:hypothetical protein